MKLHFYKYHGTGNDFVLINGLEGKPIELSNETVYSLCHRKYGIGADGLMVLRPSEVANFKMDYFNSDGNRSTMCGNGGRCLSKLYFELHPGVTYCSFEAVDGMHEAWLDEGEVRLSMVATQNPKIISSSAFELNTGSPHYVRFVNAKEELKEIVTFGQSIRYNAPYTEKGINVNLVHILRPNELFMATYERGVEDETYSCGTGVVAAALCYESLHGDGSPIHVDTKGGKLSVSYEKTVLGYENIHLRGPAQRVFEGEWRL